MANDEPVFACNIGALDASERRRHGELAKKLAQAILQTQERADGYGFRLRRETITLLEVAEWMSAERRCCPFFDLTIASERDDGPLWLRIEGRSGVKAFIRSELGIGG